MRLGEPLMTALADWCEPARVVWLWGPSRACAKTGQGGHAAVALGWMHSTEVSGEDLDLALEACAGEQGPRAEQALSVLRWGKERGLAVSARGLAWAVQACALGGRAQEALMLLTQLEARAGRGEEQSLAAPLYARVVEACSKGGSEDDARTSLLLLKVRS